MTPGDSEEGADALQQSAQPESERPAEPTHAAADTTAEKGDIPDAAPADKPADATVGGASDAGAAVPEQADPADEPEPQEPDPVRDPIVAAITGALGDLVLRTVVDKGDVWVRVTNAGWRPAVQWCKDHGFTYFCFLNGLDWMPSPELSTRYEQVYSADAEAEAAAAPMTTGVAGGDTRFQVFARLYDVERKIGITLKADLDDANPTVESVVPVFRGADWHERETWEMFGFEFTGHPGLRHLYLPREFEGHPMRKDFPLLARAVKPWPGLVDKEPVPGEDDEEAVEA